MCIEELKMEKNLKTEKLKTTIKIFTDFYCFLLYVRQCYVYVYVYVMFMLCLCYVYGYTLS